MSWTTLTTQSSGAVAPASWANQVKGNFDYLKAGLTYTPTFYDNAGIPTLFSNGTLSGVYDHVSQIVNGVAAVVTASSGGYTAGSLWVDLPVATGAANQIVGTWFLFGTTSGGFITITTTATTKAQLVTTGFAAYAGTPGTTATISCTFNYYANS